MACETCGMIPWKRPGRPSCADCTGAGWHVETYGGGRYGSVSWHRWREDAERERAGMVARGAWSGKPPRVEPGRELRPESIAHALQTAPVRMVSQAWRGRCAACGAELDALSRAFHPGEGCEPENEEG